MLLIWIDQFLITINKLLIPCNVYYLWNMLGAIHKLCNANLTIFESLPPPSWHFITKTCCLFWPAFGCCTHPKAGQNTLKSSLKHCFQTFLSENSLTNIWNQQKRLKTAQKSILTRFRVHAAPKSWSEYKTKTTAPWTNYETHVQPPPIPG